MRACPSYEPVASAVPSWFQSSVVTSLLFSLSLEKWWSTSGSGTWICEPHGPSGTFQTRAVESPEPDASWSAVGLHAHMNTSDVCPVSVVTCSSGVCCASPLTVDDAAGVSLASIGVGPEPARPPLASEAPASAALESAPERSSEKGSVDGRSAPSSATLRSRLAYMIPFWIMLTSWPGGILPPLMLLLVTMLSHPKVNAEWRKPDSCR
mmetsp:Transcript_7306/g.12323  ORF Transcript_7306/g.12323 Transcript_7306/m.12323 type:complete len:209 (+) Transcript_7306:892-1518(+)